MEKIEEYNALRQEIMQKDGQFNDYRKSAYAVTTAVLAFSLTQSEPFISLVPILIIIPLYIISEDSLRAMSKIGAYIRVYYNDYGFNWERRNMKYCELLNEENKKKRKREVFSNNAMIYLALTLICGALSVYKTYIQYSYSVTQQPVFADLYFHEALIRSIIIIIIVVTSILIIYKKKVYMDDERELYKDRWEEIKKCGE